MLHCSASLEELSGPVVCRFLESSQVGYAKMVVANLIITLLVVLVVKVHFQ